MISEKRAKHIISYARQLKNYWHTNDPYELAAIYGYQVSERESCYPGFTAQIVGIEGYKTVISINKAYNEFSKRLLCAHELGHAFFHSEDVCNHFAGNDQSIDSVTEHEANLFAVALLTDNFINDRIIVPLEKMNNYMLKTIIDYNLHMEV